MAKRQYMIMIVGSAGRYVRRVAVTTMHLRMFAGGLGAALVTFLGLALHSWSISDDSAEAQRLRAHNAELNTLLMELEPRVPGLKDAAMRAELRFAQVWAKSGLNPEPRMLGVGPTEEDSGLPLQGVYSGAVMEAEPVALAMEVDRVRQDGNRVQQRMGALLEYFLDAERILANTPSIHPTQPKYVTSGFGKRRDPIHQHWVMHKGIDLGGYIGMEVLAPADGVVIFTGRRGAYGKTVVVDHGYGLQTHFAHLSKYRSKPGDRVTRGQVIAEMGNTGKSTGPHLHYEVRRLGQPLNPRPFMLD